MEASTLQKKKNTISKGKVKKNIKNVLSRPDPVFWPEITEVEQKRLEIRLNKYRIKIPEFKKAHWKELKLIPKEERPKAPKLKKVDGLLFGLTECSNSINDGQCSGVIIEATVNPRMIVQPVIELCISKNVPILCMNDLRKLTLASFGVKTSCLGLKNEFLLDLRNEILDISKLHPKPKSCEPLNKPEEKMDVQENVEKSIESMDTTEYPYLYRTSKKCRVFVPITGQEKKKNSAQKFTGQDFIELADNVEQNKTSKAYMKMILKRISNNPDRVKKK